MGFFARQQGVNLLFHYLDDFLTMGSPDFPDCLVNLAVLLSIFKHLDIPVTLDESEGPSTRVIILGIEIDTVSKELRLPQRKLWELQELTCDWLGMHSHVKRDLRSFVGKLQHANKVVRPGSSFLGRMFQVLDVATRKHHCID